MMNTINILFISLAVLSIGVASNYSGHQLVRVSPEHTEHLSQLQQIYLQWQDTDGVEFWGDSIRVKGPTLIRASPTHLPRLLQQLKRAHLKVDVVMKDVQKVIDEQAKEHEKRISARTQKISLDEYNTLEEIDEYLMELSSAHDDAEYTVAGHSHEGREINIFHIGNGNRDAVGIECGIHAREWITPATCINIINDLLTNPEVEELRNSFDWYFIPVLNVDGYDYTWTTDRLWRKNRSPGSSCIGVDLNRNFDINHCGVGASANECSGTYCGEAPFSEFETQVVRDLVNDISDRLFGFWALHSYGQLYMTPWCYTLTLPDEQEEMQRVAEIAEEAIENIHGSNYEAGPCADTIYIASGVTSDWVFSHTGLIYSTTIEVRDEGQYGFLLPEDQIIPNFEENWSGIKAALGAMRKNK